MKTTEKLRKTKDDQGKTRKACWVKKSSKTLQLENFFGPKYFLIFFPAVVLVVLGVVLELVGAVAKPPLIPVLKKKQDHKNHSREED